jgi:hypothetical protein
MPSHMPRTRLQLRNSGQRRRESTEGPLGSADPSCCGSRADVRTPNDSTRTTGVDRTHRGRRGVSTAAASDPPLNVGRLRWVRWCPRGGRCRGRGSWPCRGSWPQRIQHLAAELRRMGPSSHPALLEGSSMNLRSLDSVEPRARSPPTPRCGDRTRPFALSHRGHRTVPSPSFSDAPTTRSSA